MGSATILVSARGPLAAGPLRVLCHRRWRAVVSLTRGLGWDERPDLRVHWPAHSLLDRQRGRLGLLEGRYDPDRHCLDNPRYTPVTVPEAVSMAPGVGELLAAEEARWSRSSIGHRLQEQVRVAVLPGPATLDSVLKQLAPERDDRMPPEVVGPSQLDVRPELFLALTTVLRRHPELLVEHGERVRAKVRLARSRMGRDHERRHAAEAAAAVSTILGDRDDALELLAAWRRPVEAARVNEDGADALALPNDLVFAHLAGCDLTPEATRAFFKHCLLVPVANDLDLEAAVPLPEAFLDALPVVDQEWVDIGRSAPDGAVAQALIGQFADWARVGPVLVSASAGAVVDRMPSVGPRPPDPRGVGVDLHLINPSSRAQPMRLDHPSVSWRGGDPRTVPICVALPAQVPRSSAMTVALGPLGDETLEIGAPYEVTVPIRIARSSHRLRLDGVVGVTW